MARSTEKILGVIFDSDGTLVDSEATSLMVLVELLAQLGHTVEHAWAVENWSGRDLKEVFQEIEIEMEQPLPGDFLDIFRSEQFARLEKEVTPVEGAKELLGCLQKPFCVASNAPQYKVRLCLTTAGLIDLVPPDMIFSAYDINAWKPKPDLFLHAASQLDLPPSQCAVVEDSLVGVQAALNANMRVFAYDPHQRMRPIEDVTFVRSLIDLTRLL